MVLAGLVVLLVVKPWAGPGTPFATPSPGPSPTPDSATGGYVIQGDRPYNPLLFGPYPVLPGWEIWPAGYIVRMAATGPLPLEPQATPRPTPRPSDLASPLPAPTATPRPSPPPGATVLLDMGRFENIGVIGLNTPEGVTVSRVELLRFDAGGTSSLDLVPLTAPWESTHFHVYGLAPFRGGKVLDGWLPGIYRLDIAATTADGRAVTFEVGLLVRS